MKKINMKCYIKTPGGRHGTPVFLPGESHGQRSLAGYSPWGHKESDRTEVSQQACSHIIHLLNAYSSVVLMYLQSCATIPTVNRRSSRFFKSQDWMKEEPEDRALGHHVERLWK